MREKSSPSALDYHHHHLQVTGHGAWMICKSTQQRLCFHAKHSLTMLKNLFHIFSRTKIAFIQSYYKVYKNEYSFYRFSLVNQKFMGK